MNLDKYRDFVPEEQKISLNVLMNKTIKDITINNRGMVTFHFTKKRKLIVPYSTIYDEEGNFYLLADVKFKSQEKS